MNTQNPNGNLDSISTNNNTTLAGSLTIQVGNGAVETFVIGAAPSSGAPNANTYYTGDGVNTLDGLAAAINAANSGTPLSYSGTAGSDTVISSGTLPSAATDTALSGSMTVQVGAGTVMNIVIGDPPSAGAAANTIYTGTDTGDNTIAGLAAAINNASGIGFTASVTTDANGIATLALTSGTEGADGTLTVSSGIVTVTSSGTLTSAASDTALSGSMTVQVGNGTVENVVIGDPPIAGAAANTIYTGTDSGDNTIAGVAAAINNATGIGFTASVTTDANGHRNPWP